MSRFYYFPRPYPDEIIGSLILRACRHHGKSFNWLARQITGKSLCYLPLAMSAHLVRVAEAASLDAETLLWEHTLFPYVTCYMAQTKTDQFAAKWLDGHTAANAALSQAGTQGCLGHRFCPACLIEDEVAFGEAYWHRAHNLPMAEFCPKHNIWLRQEQLPASHPVTISSGVIFLPDEQPSTPLTSLLPGELARAISVASEEYLSTHVRKESSEWAAEYRDRVIAQRMVKPGGFIASGLLASTFEATFGKPFLEQAGIPFNPNQAPWFATMLRVKQGTTFVTLKHVLMRVFLEQVKGLEPLTLSDPFYRRSGRVVRDYQSLDDKYVTSIKEAISTLRGTSKRVKVTEMLTSLGIWATYRHERSRLPKTRALIAEFRKTENSEHQIGRRKR